MIYFVQQGSVRGPIKIGYANDVRSRLNELQIGNSKKLRLIATFEGDRNTEKDLHQYFKALKLKVRGEWFKWSAEMQVIMSEGPSAIIEKLDHMRAEERKAEQRLRDEKIQAGQQRIFPVRKAIERVFESGATVPVKPAILSVKHAAVYCACSASLLNTLRARDARAMLQGADRCEGPIWVRVHGGIRYRLSDLDAWLQATSVSCGIVTSKRRPATAKASVS